MTGKSITIRDYNSEIPGRLTDPTTWTFPTCYSINANGKQIEWTIMVRAVRLSNKDMPIGEIRDNMFINIDKSILDNGEIDSDICGYIFVNSSMTGGKTRKSVPDIIKVGLGVGKAKNNTVCQALRNALGKYNKQLKNGSTVPNLTNNVTVPPTAAARQTKLYFPMLAQGFNEQKKPISYPVAVQPKYNGIRCIATMDTNGEIILYSRKLKSFFGFATIRNECAQLIRSNVATNVFLDGELYKHEMPLQRISGITRREAATPEDVALEEHIDYMIYDCFAPDRPTLTATMRAEMLSGMFAAFQPNTFMRCQLVPSIICANRDEIMAQYKLYLAAGFEGAMARVDAPYEYGINNRHSKVLLKIKETFDAEFMIIGWEVGAHGKAANSLMMICQTETGNRFTVTPALPILEREAFARKMSEIELNKKTHFENVYFGKQLIVYFDEKSPDGVPQRARTKMEVRTWD